MPRLGEFSLIAAFRERLPGPHGGVVVGSGDDAAIVRAGGAFSVVSVDTTVDGVHARLDLGDPLQAARDFGWRGLTTALSDLAATGVGPGPGATDRDDERPNGPNGHPSSPSPEQRTMAAEGPPAGIEVYVAVTLPPQLGDDRILAIADGMAEAAEAYGASVIGGDVTTGPVAVMSTTVVGWLDRPGLTRSGARPGDLVGLTGPVGAAGAGLALTIGEVPDGRGPGAVDALSGRALRAAYQRPVPHLAQGSALLAAGATAAIDLSDGLLADAGHVARASGVRLALDADAVPIAAGVAGVAEALGREPLLFAQSAGEDFVLLAAVPEPSRAAAEAAGVVAWIGRVEARADGEPGEVTGLPLDPTGRAGHDHRR